MSAPASVSWPARMTVDFRDNEKPDRIDLMVTLTPTEPIPAGQAVHIRVPVDFGP